MQTCEGRPVAFGGTCIGKGYPPAIALSVTDALGPEMAALRATEIAERTGSLDRFGVLCVKDDMSDPETFVSTVASVSGMWDGDLMLESRIPASLVSASSLLDGAALLSGCTMDEMLMIGGATGLPVVLRSDDMESLLEASQSAGDMDVVLDPATVSMKGCLETNTDLHRLSERMACADRPVMTRAWSGEYALSVASVSLMRYGSIIVLDDMDPCGCRVLDRIASRKPFDWDH